MIECFGITDDLGGQPAAGTGRGDVTVARVSLSLYEEEELPVDVREERFAFGAVVYFTLGGFGTADMVCLHLSPAQLAAVGDAIAGYRAKAADEGGRPG